MLSLWVLRPLSLDLKIKTFFARLTFPTLRSIVNTLAGSKGGGRQSKQSCTDYFSQRMGLMVHTLSLQDHLNFRDFLRIVIGNK